METTTTPQISLPDTIGPHARVWIYQSDRELTELESDELNAAARDFTTEWQAHGTNLIADHALYFNRFLALFVDESQHNASGCSIDASVRFIQSMEKKFGINLLGRTQVAYIENDQVKTMEMNELDSFSKSGKIDTQTLVFNNLVATKSQMETSWIGPLSESWHARIIS